MIRKMWLPKLIEVKVQQLETIYDAASPPSFYLIGDFVAVIQLVATSHQLLNSFIPYRHKKI